MFLMKKLFDYLFKIFEFFIFLKAGKRLNTQKKNKFKFTACQHLFELRFKSKLINN
jgi:hypothetical protein